MLVLCRCLTPARRVVLDKPLWNVKRVFDGVTASFRGHLFSTVFYKNNCPPLSHIGSTPGLEPGVGFPLYARGSGETMGGWCRPPPVPPSHRPSAVGAPGAGTCCGRCRLGTGLLARRKVPVFHSDWPRNSHRRKQEAPSRTSKMLSFLQFPANVAIPDPLGLRAKLCRWAGLESVAPAGGRRSRSPSPVLPGRPGHGP